MKKNPSYDSQGNILVRLLVGLVFLSEGIQKLLFPAADGAGRFAGATEIICGTLLIIGLFTRLAAVPLLVVILVAIYITKIPMLEQKGFWATAHEGRADFCMLIGLIFLVIYGAGKYSADSNLSKRKK